MVPRSRVKASIIYKVEERGHSKNIIFYPGTETSFINCNCKNTLLPSKGGGWWTGRRECHPPSFLLTTQNKEF